MWLSGQLSFISNLFLNKFYLPVLYSIERFFIGDVIH